jgi:hypothetical protein
MKVTKRDINKILRAEEICLDCIHSIFEVNWNILKDLFRTLEFETLDDHGIIKSTVRLFIFLKILMGRGSAWILCSPENGTPIF